MSNVTVVSGAGAIGQAIARRISAGKHVLLADLLQKNAEAAAKVLDDAGFDVSTALVDISSRAFGWAPCAGGIGTHRFGGSVAALRVCDYIELLDFCERSWLTRRLAVVGIRAAGSARSRNQRTVGRLPSRHASAAGTHAMAAR